MSRKREERGVDFFNFSTECALKLVECRICALFTLSGNKCHHAFGFGKVKLPVQKSSFCKFAGSGSLCAVLQNKAKYFLHQNNAAVAVDFDSVLASVAVRSTENKADDLINGCFAVKNFAEISTVTLRSDELFPIDGNKNPVGNFSRIFSGYSDNSNAAGTQRCGYGGDC